MLSITSILTEQYTDTISAPGASAAMYLELTSDDPYKWVTVGLIIEAAANSNLDPSKITVKYQSTDNETEEISYVVVPDWATLYETDGAKKSTIILEVPAGTYQVLVGGDNQTAGAFTADVYVPGGTEENPTSVPQFVPVLAQAGLQQMSGQWHASMESIYKKLLGTNYRKNISADYPELNVTETGRLNETDARILGIVAGSGDVTAALTKTEPTPEPPDPDVQFTTASLQMTEKANVFGEPTATITIVDSSESLADYNVTLNSTYTIAGSYGGADLSGVTLPVLVAGTDYKFEDGKFYFNPNGKFDFIPKGTTATLTLIYTANHKTEAKTGTGTITVAIVGANDTPVLDKAEVDITPDSTTCPIEIWSEPWSTTIDGVTAYHSDEVALVIDGKDIKIGDTVIATIADPDIGDSFEFATIGYPGGSVTFENSTWTLWNGADENKKAVGEIRLSTDKRTLYYKAAGARGDSAFASLEDGELSDKMKFTFTVTDKQVTGGNQTGEDQPSESGSCAVEFQVKRKVDAQMGLSLISTGTSRVSIKAQSISQDEENPVILLPAFFTIDYTGEKSLLYSFVDVTVTGSSDLTIPNEIATSLRNAFEMYGSGKTDGVILFNRGVISNEANAFLNSLTGDQFIDLTFRIKVSNWLSESEYVISETLHIVFKESTELVLSNTTLLVSQHAVDWVSTMPVEITGGVNQVSVAFYEIDFTGNPGIFWPGGEYPSVSLEKEVDYKCEIVVMDQATGKLGVVFSFNPNGKFNDLNVGQNATVTLYVLLEDTINPILSSTSEVVVTVVGEEASVVPTFKANVNLSTEENQSLTIEGKDIAESTKTGADLVIDEVHVKVEDVELINDTIPNPGVAIDGYYVIARPVDDEQTVQLKSGTVLLFDAEGKIKFDPTGRTAKLPPYNESDPATYADEKITLRVADISNGTATTAQEFSIRVTGTTQSSAPAFKDPAEVTLGSFQNEMDMITADRLATSTNPNAELSIKSITLQAEWVVEIDENYEEYYILDGDYLVVSRPAEGEIKITFVDEIHIYFTHGGELRFDPTEMAEPIPPYNGQTPTYKEIMLEKVVIEDLGVAPPVSAESEYPVRFPIRAKGVIYPLFNTVDGFNTPEDIARTIKASDIASSTKSEAELVIEEVSVQAEDVEQVNGADPGTASDGMYKITRPESGTQTILLKSGSLITLDAAGEVTFDPTGRPGELEPGESDEEKLTLLVKDLSGVGVTSQTTREFTVRVQGVDLAVVPAFRTDVDLYTTEGNFLTIYAQNIATSTKTSAVLVIDEIYVKAEFVDEINGAAPTEDPDENGYYKIGRPMQQDNTITLKSGSLLRLGLGGVVTFDPTGRTETLPPYDPSDPDTYVEENVSFLVKDISSNPATETESIQEFTIRVEGELTETGGLQVFGGPFQANTFATVEEIPEDYAILPGYRIDGATVGTDYTFSLAEIRSSFEETGEYYESLSSPFSVGGDGRILIDKEILVERHAIMGFSGLTTEYYKITVKAVQEGTETELTVDVPLTLQYVAPPGVTTVTTLDGTEIAANAKWEISKTADHQAVMAVLVSDVNDFSRTQFEWFTISEVAVIDWKYGDWFESWTKTQTETGKDAGDVEMTALYEHVASLLDPNGTALIFALEEQEEPGEYCLEFTMNTGSGFNFIGYGQSLELLCELIVMDNDYLGQTPIRFTIAVQG